MTNKEILNKLDNNIELTGEELGKIWRGETSDTILVEVEVEGTTVDSEYINLWLIASKVVNIDGRCFMMEEEYNEDGVDQSDYYADPNTEDVAYSQLEEVRLETVTTSKYKVIKPNSCLLRPEIIK